MCHLCRIVHGIYIQFGINYSVMDLISILWITENLVFSLSLFSFYLYFVHFTHARTRTHTHGHTNKSTHTQTHTDAHTNAYLLSSTIDPKYYSRTVFFIWMSCVFIQLVAQSMIQNLLKKEIEYTWFWVNNSHLNLGMNFWIKIWKKKQAWVKECVQ